MSAAPDVKAAGGTSPAASRMVEQDVAKGIAMLLVIALHTLCLKKSVYSFMGGIFGFIMPFFFFLAGYTHRPYRFGYREIIRKRAKQILIPFLKYSFIIMVIAGAYYMIAEGYTLRMVAESYLVLLLSKPFSNVIGLQSANGLYSCVMVCWFLELIFTASFVFYAVVDYALAKASRLVSVLFGLVMVTMVFAHFDFHLPFFLCEAPAIAAIMLLGAFFGQKQLLGDGFKRRDVVLNSVVAYGVFVALALQFKQAGFMAGGFVWDKTLREWSLLLCVIYAVVGSYPFVHACKGLRRAGVVTRALVWCGNNSMLLLLLHQIVQLFLCVLLKMEPFRISLNSTVNDFRTLYLFVLEVLVTVLLILAIERVKKRFARKSGAE